MEEKIIVKSEQTNKNTLLIIGAVVSLVAGIIVEALFFGFDRVVSVWMGEIAIVAIGVFLIFLIFYFAIKKCELTITDKRAYGIAIFGKRVDLPVDSISAVGTSLFNGIAIATSSGRISFIGISNRNDIHKALSDLLINRQNKSALAPSQVSAAQSDADELKKFKELLDQGIITQEEFDAKKKELLGL